MSPSELFGVTFLLSASAFASERVLRRLHRARLRRLAGSWRMNYSPLDHLRLTPRVAGAFPVPGAARVRVLDLIYATQEGRYRYIFTAEYTTGVITGKRRVQQAASFSESQDQSNAPEVRLAPADLPLLEQYRRLAEE